MGGPLEAKLDLLQLVLVPCSGMLRGNIRDPRQRREQVLLRLGGLYGRRLARIDFTQGSRLCSFERSVLKQVSEHRAAMSKLDKVRGAGDCRIIVSVWLLRLLFSHRGILSSDRLLHRVLYHAGLAARAAVLTTRVNGVELLSRAMELGGQFEAQRWVVGGRLGGHLPVLGLLGCLAGQVGGSDRNVLWAERAVLLPGGFVSSLRLSMLEELTCVMHLS